MGYRHLPWIGKDGIEYGVTPRRIIRKTTSLGPSTFFGMRVIPLWLQRVDWPFPTFRSYFPYDQERER